VILDLACLEARKKGGKVMNNYEAPEALKLGKAQDVILDQKTTDVAMDNFGVPFSTIAESIDDFDE
jgi:hypothetical protein